MEGQEVDPFWTHFYNAWMGNHSETQGARRAPWGGRLRRPWGRWIDFEIIPNGYLQRDTHPCIVEVGPKRIHFLSFHSQLRSSPGHLKGGVRDPWLKLNI